MVRKLIRRVLFENLVLSLTLLLGDGLALTAEIDPGSGRILRAVARMPGGVGAMAWKRGCLPHCWAGPPSSRGVCALGLP